MRVGALPQYPTNALKYNLTWSVDGLINEYGNPCDAIHEGKLIGQEDGVEHAGFGALGEILSVVDRATAGAAPDPPRAAP